MKRNNKLALGLLLLAGGLFCMQLPAYAQKDTTGVLDALTKFEKALVVKDSAALNTLLHRNMLFGHSNGWIQTKRDVINDMVSGFLMYNKIENLSTQIDISKGKAIVREHLAVNGARDGKTFDVNLFVMEVWLKNKQGWQLFSRQGTRL